MKLKKKSFKVCRRKTADDRIKKVASVGFGVHTKENPKVERVEKSTDILEATTGKTLSHADPRHCSAITRR